MFYKLAIKTFHDLVKNLSKRFVSWKNTSVNMQTKNVPNVHNMLVKYVF